MKRHRTDLVSLIFGLVFLVIAGEWLLAGRLNVDLPAVGWLAAVGADRGRRRRPGGGRPRPARRGAAGYRDGPQPRVTERLC